MKAVVTGENDERVGVNLLDNNDIGHVIEMEFDGEIKYHEQDGYPDDPDKRTIEGNEHVEQARRFAKYWVYRKRGYETLEPRRNPDRIVAAAVALAPLTPDAAQRYLGDLLEQLVSINDESGTPPVTMPDGVDPADAVYQQDVYLGLENDTLGTAAARALTNDNLMDLIGQTVDVGGERPNGAEELPAFREFLAAETDHDVESLSELRDGLLLAETSGVHIHWEKYPSDYRTQWGEQPDIDREPDARIEIFPYEPASITDLEKQVARHLLCQVRDCYLTMGIAPPEEFRLLGHGRHDATTWYANYDCYAEYFDPELDTTAWYEQYTPENAYEHEADTENVRVEQ